MWRNTMSRSNKPWWRNNKYEHNLKMHRSFTAVCSELILGDILTCCQLVLISMHMHSARDVFLLNGSITKHSFVTLGLHCELREPLVQRTLPWDCALAYWCRHPSIEQFRHFLSISCVSIVDSWNDLLWPQKLNELFQFFITAVLAVRNTCTSVQYNYHYSHFSFQTPTPRWVNLARLFLKSIYTMTKHMWP